MCGLLLWFHSGPLTGDMTANSCLHDFDDATAKLSKDPAKPPSMMQIILHSAGLGVISMAVALGLASVVITLLMPMLFSELITSLMDPTVSESTLWLYASGFFVLPLLGSLCTQHSLYFAHIHATRARAAACAAIYRKALVVDMSARKAGSLDLNVGTIVNLLSTDTLLLSSGARHIPAVIRMPFLIILAMVLLYREVEWAALIGLVLMLLSSPVNAKLMSKVYTLYFAKMKIADERVKIVNELLGGIRIIKYYAWERPFARKITQIRDRETSVLLKFNYFVLVAFTVLSGATVIIMTLVVFLVYTVAISTHLDPARAFTTIQLFALIQMPLTQLPLSAVGLLQAIAAGNRIMQFIRAGELPAADVRDAACTAEDERENVAIHVRGAKFAWPADAAAEKSNNGAPTAVGPKPNAGETKQDAGEGGTAATEEVTVSVPGAGAGAGANAGAGVTAHEGPVVLDIPNLAIKKGEFVAVVGSVGSFKSSLMQALLGDMPRVEDNEGTRMGRVDTYGTVAYAAQQAWICNQTLQENILFNTKHDGSWYRRVKTACQLDADVRVLDGGDQTEIGERGITLSGGQKARVSLARACYANCDIVIADDPLAAVRLLLGPE